MFFTFLILTFAALLGVHAAPEARMNSGNPAETLRRFPHNVVIEDYYNFNYKDSADRHYCAGSVVDKHWLLTAASCVHDLSTLKISFQRLHLSSTNGSYSVVVNSDAVHVYPTQYDDIALVRLPFTLDFSSTLQSVEIYNGPNLAAEQFVVMPGFENTTWDEPMEGSGDEQFGIFEPIWNSDSKLVYGMFSIVNPQICEASADSTFDKYLQYCTKPWSDTHSKPNAMEIGSGLIVGWPAKPQLVGIYTGSFSWNNFAKFTNAAKYLTWIRGVINN